MFLLYVDHSGDPGVGPGSSPSFVMTGLVVAAEKWQVVTSELVAWRKRLETSTGLKAETKFHSTDVVAGRIASHLNEYERLEIVREKAAMTARTGVAEIIPIVHIKTEREANGTSFDASWSMMLDLYNAYLATQRSTGLVICDDAGGSRLGTIFGERRRHVLHSHGCGPKGDGMERIVDLPVLRRSADSPILQACDACAYLLLQCVTPNDLVRRKGFANAFGALAAKIKTTPENSRFFVTDASGPVPEKAKGGFRPLSQSTPRF